MTEQDDNSIGGVEEETESPDEELYAVVTSRKASNPVGAATGVDDEDAPYHKIEFVQDVPLNLSVEIGNTTMTVRKILSLANGANVEFTKVVGEPMDITVSGRLMARGEIVVVNERYGVRISEVTRPDETENTGAMDA